MTSQSRSYQNVLMLAVLAGTLMTSSIAIASTSNLSNSAPAAVQTNATKVAHTMDMKDRVENRITTLHAKLQITKDQEEAWNQVADAMRSNEEATKKLIDERHSNMALMTAIDDLKSYQMIAKAHADGLDKVIEAFQPLYDSMTDDQKKNADTVFGSFEGHGKDAKTSPAVKQ